MHFCEKVAMIILIATVLQQLGVSQGIWKIQFFSRHNY